MRKTRNVVGMILAFALVWIGIAVLPAAAQIELEEGATFDGGICWEADGTEGITTFDGQCMTPADYDEIYSFENLDSIPHCPQDNFDCTLEEEPSIAEYYEIAPPEIDPKPASERIIGEGVAAEPFTFKGYVHSLHAPIAE